jgi:hypothetical protein
VWTFLLMSKEGKEMKCNEADDMTFGFRHGVCAGQNGV